MTSTSLIVAKLTATIWSTLASWLLVLVAVPLALLLSGTWSVVAERVRDAAETVGWPRASVFALLVLLGLVVATWKQLVQSLYVGLSGREWIVRASLMLTLVLLVAIGPLANWIVKDRDVRAVLWIALPWVFGALVAVKISAAAWIAPRLQAGQLVSDRTLVAGAACWLICVLALYGVLAWLFSAPLIPRYLLGLVAILSVPLARVSAAPLALAWNRHR